MLPSEIKTGLVTGQFIITVIDNDDPDLKPQIIPAQGKVTFKPSVDYIPYPGLAPNAVTVMQGPIVGILDDEGYLCTPHPVTGEPLYRGVHLNAADDPEAAVKGWSWSASPSLTNSKLAVKSINFVLNTDEVVDLGKLISVPSTPGYGLPQAESSALRAEAAAQVALDVKAMADAGDFDGEQGLPGNATMRVDMTVGTRVFITDGVAERMVYGDTGLRDITGELVNGWTVGDGGWVRVRRYGSTVSYYIKHLIPPATGSSVFWNNIPLGFMSNLSASYRSTIPTSATTVVVCTYRRFEQDIQIPRNNGVIGSQYDACTVNFEVDSAWPTTLPGTPA